MKIMLAGDTHGDFRNVKQKIDFAKRIGGIERIVILGDFGLWWGHDALVYINEIQKYAEANSVQVFAIPGNHENYEWWNAVIEHSPSGSHGWVYLTPHVLLSPRVQTFKWGSKQFTVAGGAVSIDRDYREHYRLTKGKRIWSPDEQLTDEEVDLTRKIGNKVKTDYLLTHDCSNFTPFRDRLKPDMESQIHRQRIDKVITNLNPRMHFHGHMHTKYEWNNTLGTGAFGSEPDVEVATFGLECDSEVNSWGVLDLVTDTFKWGPHVLQSV